jgi:hypothetical protein
MELPGLTCVLDTVLCSDMQQCVCVCLCVLGTCDLVLWSDVSGTVENSRTRWRKLVHINLLVLSRNDDSLSITRTFVSPI